MKQIDCMYLLFVLKQFTHNFSEIFPIELIYLITKLYFKLSTNLLSLSHQSSLLRINNTIYCSKPELIERFPVNEKVLQILLCGDEICYIDTTNSLCCYREWPLNRDPGHKSEVILNNIKYICDRSTYMSAAIAMNGDLYMWTNLNNIKFQNKKYYYGSLPFLVKELSNVKMVSCGEHYTAAITMNGDLYAWMSYPDSVYPATLSGTPSRIGSGYVHVACNYKSIMGINANGHLFAYGNGTFGQLGSGNHCYHKDLAQVLINDPVQFVSCGTFHTMAVTNYGDLYAWGYNGYGQLGLGHYNNVSIPQKVLSNIASVSCGSYHTIITGTNGSIYGCGNNSNGQLLLNLNQKTIHTFTEMF